MLDRQVLLQGLPKATQAGYIDIIEALGFQQVTEHKMKELCENEDCIFIDGVTCFYTQVFEEKGVMCQQQLFYSAVYIYYKTIEYIHSWNVCEKPLEIFIEEEMTNIQTRMVMYLVALEVLPHMDRGYLRNELEYNKPRFDILPKFNKAKVQRTLKEILSKVEGIGCEISVLIEVPMGEKVLLSFYATKPYCMLGALMSEPIKLLYSDKEKKLCSSDAPVYDVLKDNPLVELANIQF